MKVPIYLLCFIFLFKWTESQLDSACYFRNGTDSEFYKGRCLCGPENQTVSRQGLIDSTWSRQENNYCCVQNTDTCKVNASTKVCPNATVLYTHQPCHGRCELDINQKRRILCPSNPNYCMNSYAFGDDPVCDGRRRCKEYCSGTIE